LFGPALKSRRAGGCNLLLIVLAALNQSIFFMESKDLRTGRPQRVKGGEAVHLDP
jgi:hypothetical protein